MPERSRPWLAIAGYVATFAWLFAAWLPHASTSFTAGNNPLDSRLHTFVLAWGARALWTNPLEIFAAPMNYPAPDQLTSADHFLSSQIFFAPIYWLSDNAVLATNLVVMASYPAAAFAMERLLAALGIGAAAAWFAGLAFALGPAIVPASVHVYQHPTAYLPLVAWTLLRLRREVTWRRSATFAVVLGLAAFSGYYMALLASLTAALWATLELVWPEASGRGTRLRFLLHVAVMGVLVGGLLYAFSQPYGARAAGIKQLAALTWASTTHGAQTGDAASPTEAADAPATTPDLSSYPIDLLEFLFWSGSLLPLGVAGLGLLTIAAGPPGLRRVAAAGALFAAVATLLIAAILRLGIPAALAPYLGFFRYFTRLQIVTGFGVALLCAAALDGVARNAGTGLAAVISIAASAALLALRGSALVTPRLDRVGAVAEQRPAYEAAARLVDDAGGGAILELPLNSADRRDLRADAMMGQTIHRKPIVSGFAAMLPFHVGLLQGTIARLPAEGALQDLVDMTHVRWILLRPAADWGDAATRARFAGALSAVAGGENEPLDGFLLQEIHREPRHPEWFRAISQGYRPGYTLLGASLEPLAPSDARGEIVVPGTLPPVRPGKALFLRVEIKNLGGASWPGGMTARGSAPGEVYIEARWLPATSREADSRSPAPLPEPSEAGLRRDLPAGESQAEIVIVPAPSAPGDYRLELRLRQRGSAAFDDATSPPAVIPLRAGADARS